MALADFFAELDQLTARATAAFDSAADPAALEAARVEFLGAKSGALKTAQKSLAAVPGPEKPDAGKRFNEVKAAIEAAFACASERASATKSRETRAAFDLTLPGRLHRLGHLHP